MQRVFTLAQRAPSNCNTQPWVVRMASGEAASTLRRRLSDAGRDPAQHQPDFPFDGRCRASIAIDSSTLPSSCMARWASRATTSQGVPPRAAQLRVLRRAAHAFVFLPEALRAARGVGLRHLRADADAAAHRARVASCPQAALSFHPQVVREVLAVPAGHRLLLGIAIGYEDASQPVTAARVGRAALGEPSPSIDSHDACVPCASPIRRCAPTHAAEYCAPAAPDQGLPEREEWNNPMRILIGLAMAAIVGL